MKCSYIDLELYQWKENTFCRYCLFHTTHPRWGRSQLSLTMLFQSADLIWTSLTGLACSNKWTHGNTLPKKYLSHHRQRLGTNCTTGEGVMDVTANSVTAFNNEGHYSSPVERNKIASQLMSCVRNMQMFLTRL